MSQFYKIEALELLAPAFHHRAHLTTYVIAGECTYSKTTREKLPRQSKVFSRASGHALRIGLNVLFALWGIAALGLWLVVAVGFLR